MPEPSIGSRENPESEGGKKKRGTNFKKKRLRGLEVDTSSLLKHFLEAVVKRLQCGLTEGWELGGRGGGESHKNSRRRRRSEKLRSASHGKEGETDMPAV